MANVAYPPLSCRTSPPQGGRSDGRTHPIHLQNTTYREAKPYLGLRPRPLSISPREGEMSGRTEGGEFRTLTFKDNTP